MSLFLSRIGSLRTEQRAVQLLLIILIVTSLSALATTVYAETIIQKCGGGKRVTCVVDGDTIWFQGERIRLMGYDTPELKTNICGGQKEKNLAILASTRLVEILNGQPFNIERHGLDKYGRTLAIIRSNGRDVGEMLIKERLARSWPDGDEFWCK